MSENAEPFPIISPLWTFVPTNICMICKEYVESPNTFLLNLGRSILYIICCNTSNCLNVAKYNYLREMCENKCICEDPDRRLFAEEKANLVTIPRTDGSITQNCCLKSLFPLRFSQSRKCIGIWVEIDVEREKLVTLRELIKHNPWIREKFQRTNGIHLVFEDSPFWSTPKILKFRKEIEHNIKELNEEFFPTE